MPLGERLEDGFGMPITQVDMTHRTASSDPEVLRRWNMFFTHVTH